MNRLVRGIDVGAPQGAIAPDAWVSLAEQGIEFGFLRCSEDYAPVDATFEGNVQGTREASVAAGAYHLASFHRGVDPAALAAHHFEQARAAGFDGVLGHVLDLEIPVVADWPKLGCTGEQIVADAATYLATMTTLSGKPAFLYSYSYYLLSLAGGPAAGANPLLALGAYPLWLASYPLPKGFAWPSDAAALPTHVPWAVTTVWQVADGGVSGFRTPAGTPCDTDVMLRTTFAQLAGLS